MVIWLDASVEVLAKRLQKDRSRPLLQQTELTTTLEQLLAERRSRYQQADLTIPITRQQSPTVTADSILEQLPTILRPTTTNPPAETNGGAQNTEGMA